jgi:hypothetical protein
MRRQEPFHLAAQLGIAAAGAIEIISSIRRYLLGQRAMKDVLEI